MNVLLIASVPDPRHDPAWSATADAIAIREAVRALAVAAKSAGANVVVPEHPEIVSLLASILPVSQLRVIMNRAEPVLTNLRRAFLIGGCDRELALARRVATAEIPVIPIASTGGASAELLANFAHNGDLRVAEVLDLKTNTVYGPLFERYLSS